MTDLELAGRKALVTGGAQGLGRKFAEYLTAAGATVVVADLQDEKGKEVAESIGGTFVHLDVTDDASWEAAVAQAVSEARRARHPRQQRRHRDRQPLRQPRPATSRAASSTSTSSAPRSASSTPSGPWAPAVRRATGGSVINVASVAAHIAFPALSQYSASKSAVDRITRIAADGGRQARPTACASTASLPGLIPNEMGAGLANELTAMGLFESAEAAVGQVVELTPSGGLGHRGGHRRGRGLPRLRPLEVHQRRRPVGRRRNGDVNHG